MKKLFLAIIFVWAIAITPSVARSFDYENIAKHPRLLLHKGDITEMKVFAATSSNARLIHEKIIASADVLLATTPVKYELEGTRLLDTSREVLKRIFYLSYAFVTTENMDYARRAEREMLAVSSFKDWNPSHFLDTAEMTLALAIGYDWLYNVLPVHSRSIIGTAIYEKGLRATENSDNAWFFSASNNWNQVCNAAILCGALATLERSPEYCKALIDKCIESNKKALAAYSPDGIYPEGFGYWEYGTTYQTMLVAALQSALNTDADITTNRGFMRSAEFMNFMVAPSGKVYNFGDSPDVAHALSAKYWFAATLEDASVANIDEQFITEQGVTADRLLPLYMIFAHKLPLDKGSLPKSKSFFGGGSTPLYIYRSGWSEPTDTYFAIKGGKAATSHGHIDAGSFIYEWRGVRWAVELGNHPYEPLENGGIDLWNPAQNSSRWDIFRIGIDSHNTLKINGKRHDVDAHADIIEHFTSTTRKGAVVDMTALFAGDVRKAHRSAELDKKDFLTITDHIVTGDKAATFEWQMATCAEAEIVGPSAIVLRQDGEEIYLKLRTKGRSDVKIWPAHDYKSCEIQDEGVRRVGFVVEVKPNQTVDIEVTLSPARSNVLSRLREKLSGNATAKK